MTDYAVWFHHAAHGYPLVLADKFLALSYTKVTNGVGAFSITLPKTFDVSLIAEDTRIVIWRKPRGGTSQIDFAGFVRKIEKPTRNNSQTFVISGFDLNDLLRRRIIAYAAGSAQAEKSDQADDMIKAIVRENLGASAIAARDLTASGFTVQADAGLGTSIEKGFSWRNVLTVLQEVADSSHSTEASATYFGIVPLNTGWECEFRTNIVQWGLDHRYPNGAAGVVIFSLELANINEVNRVVDWSDERNYAYAGGGGEGADRNIQEAQDAARVGASPFNRCETFADVRDRIIDNEIMDAADSAVREGRPRNLFSGTVLDTTRVYQRDWYHGDYVTGVYLGESIDCRIETITVDVVGNNESVKAYLRSES